MANEQKKAADKMEREQFRAERLYLMSLSVAKSMLGKGIISRDEYSEIDTILLKQYRPPLATLLAGKTLDIKPVQSDIW